MSAEGRPSITCRELLAFLHLYREDELPEDRRSEFDRHLVVCDPRRAYIRLYEGAIKLGRAAFGHPDRKSSSGRSCLLAGKAGSAPQGV